MRITPGPWTWFNGYLVTCNEDGSIPLNSRIICTQPIEFLNNDSKEADANAKLIALAPELWEALKLATNLSDDTKDPILIKLKNVMQKIQS